MEKSNFLSVPAAILIGSVIISLSILISGGVIRPKGSSIGSKGTTTTTSANEDSTSGSGGDLKTKLLALAEDLQLDQKKFQTCMDNSNTKEEINKDISDAQDANINGTPGFVIGKSSADGKINGIKVAGAYPYETFKSIFDQLTNNVALDTIKSSGEDLELATANINNNPTLGDKNAPVTIIEFSDYECPFCKRHFDQTLPSIKKDYIDSGKVKLVFRDFIAVPAHNPAAETEAIAASCAREQGGDETYFKFHDLVFSKTKANGGGI